jgi:hypothetical protein
MRSRLVFSQVVFLCEDTQSWIKQAKLVVRYGITMHMREDQPMDCSVK